MASVRFVSAPTATVKCVILSSTSMPCSNTNSLQSRLHQWYTCLNGHLHETSEKPNGVKLGDVPIKAPCPLYTHKTLFGSMEPGQEFVDEKLSGYQAAMSTQKWKIRRCWIATLSLLAVGLVVTLVLFVYLTKQDRYASSLEDLLTPPLVGPNGPATGQSVYKGPNGSLQVCGFNTGKYSCETIKPKSEDPKM
jgi:hypothetical protein